MKHQYTFLLLNIIVTRGPPPTSLELERELYFYLNTVNLSDKIIIIKITIYFNLYKHDLKIKK